MNWNQSVVKTKETLYGSISLDLNDLVGKTIVSAETVKAESSRTYDYYLAVKCSDGTRILFSGHNVYDPQPSLVEMKKTDFFTVDELVKKLESDIRKEAQYNQNRKERDLVEYRKLQERLGIKNGVDKT